MRGCNFAHAVADNSGGNDSIRAPQSNQRNLQGEDGGLCDFGLVHPGRALVPRKLLHQRPFSEFAKQSVALFDLVAKRFAVRQQLAAHGPPLRALAGEDEDGFRVSASLAGDQGRSYFSGERLFEALQQFLAAGRDETEAMRQMGAARRGCGAKRPGVGGRWLEQGEVICDRRKQSFARMSGNGQNEGLAASRYVARRFRAWGRGLENDVRVGSSEAE